MLTKMIHKYTTNLDPKTAGSEIFTSLDFEWSKKGCAANVPDFEWDLKPRCTTI